MVSPYENIVIGNFLYGLGFRLGQSAGSDAPSACINLLQQTRLDGKFGDVLLQTGGLARVIEFKRITNKGKKEQRRSEKLRIMLADSPHLVEASRKVHWHALTGFSGVAEEVDVTLTRYIDLGQGGAVVSLAAFTQQTALAMLSPSEEPPKEHVADYLSALASAARVSGSNNGGILVHISPDGQLHYAALRDLSDLELDLRMLAERERQLTRSLLAQRELDMEQSHERERQQSFSPDITP
ncbi:hypothetical protein ABT364_05765 [Massilia sp. SR12]